MSAVVSGPGYRAALVGALLAVLTAAFVALLPEPTHGLQFLAVLLGFIAGAYLGFAVADGTTRALVIEAAGIAVFVSLAAASLWFASPWLLAAGYIAHGAWDVAHHPRAITTTVAGWYPPFCLVYDVLVGVFVVAWLA